MELLERLSCGEDPAALVTILRTRGSTPREAGAKMAVFFDGRTAGTIGGGCVEAGLTRDALDIIRDGGYRFKTVDLSDPEGDDDAVCGGTMDLLIESLQPTGRPDAKLTEQTGGAV
jgi:xanthine dehydrogenase accessory factor